MPSTIAVLLAERELLHAHLAGGHPMPLRTRCLVPVRRSELSDLHYLMLAPQPLLLPHLQILALSVFFHLGWLA